MMYSFLILFATIFSGINKKQVEIITLEELQAKTIQQNNNTLYVVNFWATWCKPCVAELPYFEKAHKEFSNNNVKVILVSLDFTSDKEKVNQFIQNNNIENDVYLLQAGDPNIWINKVDSSWSGGIPATIIYKKGKKLFFQEGDFNTQDELDLLIKTKIK